MTKSFPRPWSSITVSMPLFMASLLSPQHCSSSRAEISSDPAFENARRRDPGVLAQRKRPSAASYPDGLPELIDGRRALYLVAGVRQTCEFRLFRAAS